MCEENKYKHFFKQGILYLENGYNNYIFDDSLRSKYLKQYLTKFIRIVKCIQLLDLNGFQSECDILVRTLDEMIIDIAYLETNPENNYKQLDLYSEGSIYKIMEEQCSFDKIDVMSIEGMEEYKNKYDEYIKKYGGFFDRWSGLNYRTEAMSTDEKENKSNPIMTYEMLYMKLYKANLHCSHNTPINLNAYYSKLNNKPMLDNKYFYNINYVIILIGILYYILPDIFKNEPNFIFDFDSFLADEKLNDNL